ncbi:hypothetical protein TWF694_008962 [Orbilia ellipsospora]|uniref:Uncharacterized protein n=1 Tax=Orbilia ellipsospora TaxID=2528407 RepID=A0AAV9XEZ2_9PEZI
MRTSTIFTLAQLSFFYTSVTSALRIKPEFPATAGPYNELRNLMLCNSLLDDDTQVFFVDTQQTTCEDEGGTSEWNFVPTDPPRPKTQSKPNAFIFPENFDFFNLETVEGDYIDMEDPAEPEYAAGPFITRGAGHFENSVRTVWTTSHAKRRPREFQNIASPGDNFQFVGTADKALQNLKLQGYPVERGSTAKFWLGYSANPDPNSLVLLTIQDDNTDSEAEGEWWEADFTKPEPLIETQVTEGTSPDGSDERIVTQTQFNEGGPGNQDIVTETQVDDKSAPGYTQHTITQVQQSAPDLGIYDPDDAERLRLFSSAEALQDIGNGYEEPIAQAVSYNDPYDLNENDIAAASLPGRGGNNGVKTNAAQFDDIVAEATSVDDFFNRMISIGKKNQASEVVPNTPPGLGMGLGIGENLQETSEILKSILGISGGPGTTSSNPFDTINDGDPLDISINVKEVDDSVIGWTSEQEAGAGGLPIPQTGESFAASQVESGPDSATAETVVQQEAVQEPAPNKSGRGKLKLTSSAYNNVQPVVEEVKEEIVQSETIPEQYNDAIEWTTPEDDFTLTRGRVRRGKKQPGRTAKNRTLDFWEKQAQPQARPAYGYGKGYRVGTTWVPKTNTK